MERLFLSSSPLNRDFRSLRASYLPSPTLYRSFHSVNVSSYQGLLSTKPSFVQKSPFRQCIFLPRPLFYQALLSTKPSFVQKFPFRQCIFLPRPPSYQGLLSTKPSFVQKFPFRQCIYLPRPPFCRDFNFVKWNSSLSCSCLRPVMASILSRRHFNTSSIVYSFPT